MDDALHLPEPFVAKAAVSTTKPSYLIEIGFKSGTLRYSTRGFQTWNSYSWVSSPWDYSMGRLGIKNGSPPIAALIVGQGSDDLPVTVWMFYGDTPADSGAVLIFDGFADGASELTDNIVMPLYPVSSRGMYCPRFRIIPANGFSVLPAPGTKIQWAGATFEIPDNWT